LARPPTPTASTAASTSSARSERRRYLSENLGPGAKAPGFFVASAGAAGGVSRRRDAIGAFCDGTDARRSFSPFAGEGQVARACRGAATAPPTAQSLTATLFPRAKRGDCRLHKTAQRFRRQRSVGDPLGVLALMHRDLSATCLCETSVAAKLRLFPV
jgi:hypothetical protein